ncbi:MAG TPA: HIT family protein [Rhodoferax sp.]
MESNFLSCPFCQTNEGIVMRNGLAYARFDTDPVTPGHLLLIPFRHVASYFDTSDEERHALSQLINQAKAFLDEHHAPAAYNIGVNIGEAAGQTIMHVHLHMIPRYWGDVKNPKGGVRGVIPARQSY